MTASGEALLGLDLGTSSLKAVLFDRGGQVLAAAARDYLLAHPAPGWVEQDPRQWWEALVGAVRDVLAAAAVSPGAVGICSQSSALVAVDEAGEPLGPAPTWLDRRAGAECDLVRATLDEDRLLQLSGNRLDSSYLLPKALWLRTHRPEAFARARHFLHANGFLIHRLTGVATTDLTEGGMSLLYDMAARDWSPELLEAFDLPRDKFPPMYEPSAVVGTVTAEAAAVTGLPMGTPVVAGAMDLLSAATGAGVTAPDQSFLVLGTATVLATCISAPEPHPDLQMHNHALPGLWVHAANVDFGGAVLSWVRDLFRAAGAELSYEELARLAGDTAAGDPPLLFLPYFVGQRAPLWDDHCRGVIFGLHPDHGPGHLARAAIEGNALALGRIQDLQESVHGRPIAEVRISGGQSALPLVNQVMADVTGRPVLALDAPEVTCHGAALLAGLGVGVYASPEEFAVAQRVVGRYEPDPERHARYREAGALLAEVYAALRPALDRLWEMSS